MFAKIAIFISEMLFDSASVLIRFFEVFPKDSSSKVGVHAYWAITYAYTAVFSVDFVPKSRNFEPKCDPILIRSIPFNSE